MTPSSQQHRTEIDLSALSWCDASGLVAIACFAQAALRNGDHVVLTAPRSSDVHNWLSVMGLGRELDDMGVTHDLVQVQDHGSTTLMALQRFDGAAGASALAQHVFEAVLPASKKAATALFTGLSEAGENVIEHSGETSGFMAAQQYPKDGRLVFAVGDPGLGVKRTLGRAEESDAGVIRRAMRLGSTGTDDVHRGNGIPDILRRLGSVRGTLSLTSGTASLTRGRQGQGVAKAHAHVVGTVLAGTCHSKHR